MKIEFAQTTINRNGEIPKSFSIETRRKSQTEFPLQSASARIFDRGNAKICAAFTIERSHSDVDSAAYFAATHAAELGNLSPTNLSFSFGNNGGKTEFENAVLSKIKIDANEILTTAQYEFYANKPKETL